jgi:hypothetical protein
MGQQCFERQFDEHFGRYQPADGPALKFHKLQIEAPPF